MPIFLKNVISSKLKNDVQIRSIFSENVIIPDERKNAFEKK